ncbi:MAG: BRcat domain-containing protein [Prevotella sp.]
MTNYISDILKTKRLLIGKEPINGRLMIGFPIKGKLQTIAVGTSNSVPGSVSRYNGEQGSAHLSLDIDKDGNILVTNLKEQNVTYVDGVEIITKQISPNSNVELGKDKFRINIPDILKVVEKILNVSDPSEPPVYNISHLEAVWNNYHRKNIDLQKRARKQNVQARIPMFFTMGAGAISSIAFACGWGDAVKSLCVALTLIGLVFMCYSFLKSKNDTSIEDRERYMEEFQEKYICPNPKCGKFLGNYSYKLMKRQYSMTCPHCKCKFTEN